MKSCRRCGYARDERSGYSQRSWKTHETFSTRFDGIASVGSCREVGPGRPEKRRKHDRTNGRLRHTPSATCPRPPTWNPSFCFSNDLTSLPGYFDRSLSLGLLIAHLMQPCRKNKARITRVPRCYPAPAYMVHTDTCRICSAPAEPGQPLFHPCKCSGTIKYMHQDW